MRPGPRQARRPKPARRSRTVPSGDVDVTVTALGARGDGIAETSRGRIYVRDGLPGEQVRVRLTGRRGDGFAAEPVARLSESADRVAPPCPHFGTCGGCAVQHLEPTHYAAWKHDLVCAALVRRGLDAGVVAPLRQTDSAGRRRAKLAGRHERDGAAVLGFHGAASHRVVDVASCLVLRPPLAALLGPLRSALPSFVRRGEGVDLLVTETETGIDLVIAAARPASVKDVSALAAFARTNDLARVAWLDTDGPTGEVEPVAQRRVPTLRLGGVAVGVPAGAFLQASQEGEAILTAAVRDAVAGAVRIVDLFAGCGTFAFALDATGARVQAIDSNAGAIQALQAASGAAGLGGRVTGECRDLARQPLGGDELRRFDAAVFDPPRAGAADQARQLASSTVPVVVGVSCNPATFARDARILVDGGYRLAQVMPVDQFVFSHQVELVGVFRR